MSLKAPRGRKLEVPQPNQEQLQAVFSFAQKEGPRWKEKLSDCWMRANYPGHQPYGHFLQQVRNQFGPKWLEGVTYADMEKALEPSREAGAAETTTMEVGAPGVTDRDSAPKLNLEAEPKSEGAQAAIAGESWTTNPYPGGGRDSYAWDVGWRQGKGLPYPGMGSEMSNPNEAPRQIQVRTRPDLVAKGSYKFLGPDGQVEEVDVISSYPDACAELIRRLGWSDATFPAHFKHNRLDLEVLFTSRTEGTVVKAGPGSDWWEGETSNEWNDPLNAAEWTRVENSGGTIKVGDRVFWNDPDDGLASGYGTITALLYEPVDEDTIISIRKDDGGEAEALAHELNLVAVSYHDPRAVLRP